MSQKGAFAAGIAAAVLAGTFGYLLFTDNAPIDPPKPTPNPSAQSRPESARTARINEIDQPADRIGDTDPKAPLSPPPGSALTLKEAEANLVAANTNLARAADEVAAAERALDDLEREVEAVEKFVENLEESGEDPARYAEEGMLQLNPVIERYEARLAVAEAADAREAIAKEAAARAQVDVTRLREQLAPR